MRNCVLVLCLALNSLLVSGQLDSALYLNGTNEYVQVDMSINTLGISEALTVEVRVSLDSMSKFQCIAQYGACGSSQHAFNFYITTDNKLTLSVNNDGNCDYVASATTNDTLVYDTKKKNCYHLVATFSKPDTFQFYVDGKKYSYQTNGNTISSVNNPNQDISVGSYLPKSSPRIGYVNGSISDFGIYSRALSEPEVKKHFNSRLDKQTKGLLIYYSFDPNIKGSNTIVPNEAGTKFDGKVVSSSNSTPYTVEYCNGITNLERIIRNSGIDFYPNPTFNSIRFVSSEAIIQAELYSTDGRRVFHQGVFDNILSGLHKVASGIYTLKAVDAKGKVFTSKIMIH